MRSVVEPNRTAKTPEAAKQPCAAPVEIPGDIFDTSKGTKRMASRVSGSWGADRQALAACAAKNRALVTAIDAIEGQDGAPSHE